MMKRTVLVVVSLMGIFFPGALVLAGEAVLPSSCGKATLVSQPAETMRHSDGNYTPALLVHGFNGKPGMWNNVIDHSTLPGAVNPQGRTLQNNLSKLTGAAVYTLDYSAVAGRWLTRPGAGGEVFVDAVDCLLANPAFNGHKLVVVAHSMGGLITRWAVTSAPGAADRAKRLGLVVTLGTPYKGSWLAAVGVALSGVLAGGSVPSEVLRHLVHLFLKGCEGVPNDGCGELRWLLDELTAMFAFVPGSGELGNLQPWPSGITVETLASRTMLDDVGGSFLNKGTSVDLGDGVVAVTSATAGDHVEKVAGCQYTADFSRAALDDGLVWVGQKAEIDASKFNPLVSLVFGTAITTCGHVGHTRLIQLTNEVLGAVSDELTAQEPLYAYATENGIALARGTQTVHQIDGQFTDLHFTNDGRYLVAIQHVGRAGQIAIINTKTGQRRSQSCGGCNFIAPAGNSDIAWLDARDRLVRTDVSSAVGKTTTTTLHLPETRESTEHRRLGIPSYLTLHDGLAGNIVLERYYTDAGDSAEVLIIGADGTVYPTGSEGSVRGTSVSSVTAQGGARIAYIHGYQHEIGSADIDISILDPTTRKVTTIDSHQLLTSPDDGSLAVVPSDLWWGHDGQLYATIDSTGYAPATGGERIAFPRSLWRLDNTRWVKVDAGPLTAIRQLGLHLKVALVPGKTKWGSGTLYAETYGRSVKIATDVNEIAMPPFGSLDQAIVPPRS